MAKLILNGDEINVEENKKSSTILRRLVFQSVAVMVFVALVRLKF